MGENVDPKVGIKRLRQLADLLETLPENQFDYGNWVITKDWQALKDAPKSLGGKLETLGCGTTGCAMGWAITLPFAKEAGYYYKVHPYIDHQVQLCKVGSSNLGHTDHWVAAKELFGINSPDVEALFTDYAGVPGIKAKDVAYAIRSFCALREEGDSDVLNAEDIFSDEVVEKAVEHLENEEG